MHRDIMAGHNICNAIRGHLLEQQRPLYLQPQDNDGHYPWMQDKRSSRPRPGGYGRQKGVKRKATDEGEEVSQTKRPAIAYFFPILVILDPYVYKQIQVMVIGGATITHFGDVIMASIVL
jgi:hypothetical protein